MKKDSGFEAIAARAGVSVSTVDRVLNERGSVSEAKRERVILAARALDVNRKLPATWHRTIRIEVMLPRNAPENYTPFWREMGSRVAGIADRLLPKVVLARTYIDELHVEDWCSAILQPALPRDALIIACSAVEPVVAALNEIMARGVAVVTLVTDVTSIPGHAYAGVDNRAMGRTAGFLLGRMHRRNDKILVLGMSSTRQEQHERLSGFLEVASAMGQIEVLDTGESEARARAALAAIPPSARPGAVYSTCHLPDAISEYLRSVPERACWIAHELSERHRALLEEGILDLVMDQDPDAQIAWAVAKATDAVERDPHTATLVPYPQFRIFCRENLPATV